MEAEKCMVRHHTCRTRKTVVRFRLALKAQGWGPPRCGGGPDSVSPSEAREPGALIPGQQETDVSAQADKVNLPCRLNEVPPHR